MCVFREVLLVTLLLAGLSQASGNADAGYLGATIGKGSIRTLQAVPNDDSLRFDPQPFSKKMEVNSTGKIHCKIAGGINPRAYWYLNNVDPLPEGLKSINGTLYITMAKHEQSGRYTCRAKDETAEIHSSITLNVVVSPRVVEPFTGQIVHASAGQPVWLHCKATGLPQPITYWDRNTSQLYGKRKDVDVEIGVDVDKAKVLVMTNGTLMFRNVTVEDSDRYGCTAGSVAGLARNEVTLIVHPEGEPLPTDATGVGGNAVVVSISVAAAYMVLVVVLVLYCRRRKTAQRGEKIEMEMAEGREKLVGDGDEDKKVNGAHVFNGRLLPHDSGADTSEVSGISRSSKKSGQYESYVVPRSCLIELVTLGRGEFGDVLLGRMDVSVMKRMRHNEGDAEPKLRPVLVKALSTKDETQLAEFRRQLDMFSRANHANVVRLLGLCNDANPHYLILQHTDWGDLKNFLIATRTAEESAEYQSRVGNAHPVPVCEKAMLPLDPQHQVLLTTHLAAAAACLAAKRITHKDIAARNCVVTSKLVLKLSLPALTRGPNSYEYYKLHDQVIPLRWLPAEAVLESDYSMKSDVYMFAATVWEIYTKAELPFVKLNDNSVMERLKSLTLEWNVPDGMPGNLTTLLNKCWSKSAADRPSFADICEETTAILRDATADTLAPQEAEG